MQTYNGPPFKLDKSIKNHKSIVNVVRFNHAGTLMATASNDKCIHIYESDNGKLIKSMIDAHDASILYLAWVVNHDSLFLSCSSDRTIKLWDSDKEGMIKVMNIN